MTGPGPGPSERDDQVREGRPPLSFQTRLTIIVVAAAVAPLAILGMALIVTGALDAQLGSRVLLFMIAVTAVIAVFSGSFAGQSLVNPLREINAAVRRVGTGDISRSIPVQTSDVLGQLAESHNRLAADVDRRNRQLTKILSSIESASPGDGVDRLAAKAGRDAEDIFELIAGVVSFVDPAKVPEEERIPGDPLPVRAELRAGDQPFGLLVGSLPATRTWERADQALLELYAIGIGAAIRNAQLFAQVQAQNARLVELDEAKDDFLRGVSHNLQTPLTRIKANAEGLASMPAIEGDTRLGVISDQVDRLSRMVSQLLLVNRLGSGPIRQEVDVFAVTPRIRRAWDALSVADRAIQLEDGAPAWLAVGDGDQFDQVLWALLDNAVKYGEGDVSVEVGAGPTAGGQPQVWMTITSGGPGLTDDDRAWLFSRFGRGERGRATGDGSGLGLYVSRALMRGMGGDLILDPLQDGRGARFRLTLPGEHATEA